MSRPENLLAVIHLSATAVYVVVGDVVSVNDIQIKGVGRAISEDFQQGQIINFDRLKNAIRKAITDAEEMANCRIHSAWLTLSTPELRSYNVTGSVHVESVDGSTEPVVEIRHIVSALTQAKLGVLQNTHYVMHHCQQGIFLDDQSKMVDDAIGMHARKVDVMYHLMMMPVNSRQNIQKLIQDCDVSIDHVLFDAVSLAEYGLTEEDRQQGVCLIDIGASTTSVCVYREDKLILTYCIEEGGHKVTMDISADLGVTMAAAERMKIERGTVDTLSIDPSDFERFKNGEVQDDRLIHPLQLAQIIEARYKQLFGKVFQRLVDEGLMDYLQGGVVLAGGGSQIAGMQSFAKRWLNVPVNFITPHEAISAYNCFESNDEKFRELNRWVVNRSLQTAFGALLYSQSEQFKHSEKSSPDALKVSKLTKIKTWKQKLSNIFKNIL